MKKKFVSAVLIASMIGALCACGSSSSDSSVSDGSVDSNTAADLENQNAFSSEGIADAAADEQIGKTEATDEETEKIVWIYGTNEDYSGLDAKETLQAARIYANENANVCRYYYDSEGSSGEALYDIITTYYGDDKVVKEQMHYYEGTFNYFEIGYADNSGSNRVSHYYSSYEGRFKYQYYDDSSFAEFVEGYNLVCPDETSSDRSYERLDSGSDIIITETFGYYIFTYTIRDGLIYEKKVVYEGEESTSLVEDTFYAYGNVSEEYFMSRFYDGADFEDRDAESLLERYSYTEN